MSLDGYVTGPDDREGQGLGIGGERLDYWVMGGPWTYETEREPGAGMTDADRADFDALLEGTSVEPMAFSIAVDLYSVVAVNGRGGPTMSVCVACRAEQRTVVRIDSRGVPHGSPGHQVNYRWRSLAVCPECEAGLLVHFDHDCFQQPWEEPWDMDWSWPVAVDGVQRLKAGLARCPDPLQPSCGCPVHRSLRDSTEESLPRGVPVTIVLTEDGLPQVRSVRML